MNFKSHNILIDEKRMKLYDIIKSSKPDIICLSEALLPIQISNNKHLHDLTPITITKISEIKHDIIQQPYFACKQFTQKKNEEYKDTEGIRQVNDVWKNFFTEQGYQFIIFANPTECPFGLNWGNCIITKEQPEEGLVLQMGSHKKESFMAPESRSMVGIKLGGEYIFSTHLDNVPKLGAREIQTREIIDFLTKRLPNGDNKITLVGDLNAVNKDSYSEEELSILTSLSPDKVLPYDAIKMLNNYFGRNPLNTGQKYESLFQKCVSHVYSNNYNSSVMLFTDATDFDHKPLLIFNV